MVSVQVDPVMLGGHRRDPEHHSGDDRRRKQISTRLRAAHRYTYQRGCVFRAAGHRALQVDEHMYADKHKPDYGGRPM